MILLIDNYDSFSYNLYQLIGSLEPDIRVIRNDAMTVEEIAALNPAGIILSPGPGRPEDAGVCIKVVRQLGGRFPILGVCLGHQAICEAFGATVTFARELMHGKQSIVSLDHSCPLFDGLANEMAVARYHSLIGTNLPDTLKIVSTDSIGEVMAVMDEKNKVFGLQFHPESILTPQGSVLLKNFLAL